MPDESEIVKARDGAPCIGVSGPPVARVIHQCHERSIGDGRSECGADGVSDDDFEAVLTYCAEQRCMAAGLVCPGCKLETEQLGIHDFDRFVAGFSEIAVEDSGVRLVGPGEARLSVASLGSLANSWAGEAYWFWARRVIRKLRHGIRRAHIKGRAFAGDGETPSILLMEPQLADNIGMVARAMANFGLDDLRVINPRDGWPNEKARIAASGANFVIDDVSCI